MLYSHKYIDSFLATHTRPTDRSPVHATRAHVYVVFLSACCAVENGSIKRIADDEVQSGVLELVGENVALNYITCPADPKKALGIKLPYFVLIIKNVGPCRSAPFRTLA